MVRWPTSRRLFCSKTGAGSFLSNQFREARRSQQSANALRDIFRNRPPELAVAGARPSNGAWREQPQVAASQVAPQQGRQQVARVVHSDRSPCAFFERCTCGPRHAAWRSIRRCHRPVDGQDHILGERERPSCPAAEVGRTAYSALRTQRTARTQRRRV